MIVKVCGITSLRDGLAAASYGAHAVGFNFYPRSPRFVPPEAARAIGSRLPEEVWKVGVFVNEPRERVEDIAGMAGLDIVQLHGDETPADCPAGLRVWKAFRVGETFDPGRLADYPAEAFLLDTAAGDAYGGTGRTFDWRLAAGLPYRIVLAGGLDAGNVAEAIRLAQPWGVDVCSRIETQPGCKDLQKMAAFLQAVKAT